jgi:hypothetical protein
VNPLKVCPQCGTEYPANARFCEIDGTALRSAGGEQQDMVGSIVADRYHIMKKLGEGGMGQVYLAEHVKMGRKSALKVMHPGMVKDVDAISRFNREAANASRISHPNVAAVYDFGETSDGIIYLAMEFVDGPPLTKVIEQAGCLPAKRAAEIVRQTGEALAVAHDMAIVHRDLKPDNIMVAKTREGRDLVKVVDFGIAKAAGSEAQKVTKTGLVVGTPEYMSPEQLAGDKLDGRSDIYSLGLVAFNMLTGKLPFPSDSAQESMIMRLTDRPKPLAEMRPEVSWPADVQAVMDKALERDVSSRYQTASEFARDLQRAIDRMPETVAAELGTQMMQVPATRVAAQEPAAPATVVSPGVAGGAPTGPGSTVAVPTPIVSAPVTQVAAQSGKKRMLLLVGPPLALMAIGGVAYVAMKDNATNGPDSAKPAAETSAISPPNTQSGSGKSAGDSQITGGRKTGPGSGTSTGDPTPGSAVNISQELAQLETDADVDAKAPGVPLRVASLLQQMKTGNDSGKAYWVLYRAYVTTEKKDSSCHAIQQAVQVTKDEAERSKYDKRVAGAC